MENTENNEGKSAAPKFNIPTEMNYGQAMGIAPLNGSHILRKVVTDTYVTSDAGEDNMMEQLESALEKLRGKTRGFAGFLSFHYALFTLYYLLRKTDLCKKTLDKIDDGIDEIERCLMSRTCFSQEGSSYGFMNYTFGESDETVEQTVKYVNDSWTTAKFIHARSGSFESGFSLLVVSLIEHCYMKQYGLARQDLDGMRSVLSQIREFLDEEKLNIDNSSEIEAPADMQFVDISEIENKIGD